MCRVEALLLVAVLGVVKEEEEDGTKAYEEEGRRRRRERRKQVAKRVDWKKVLAGTACLDAMVVWVGKGSCVCLCV
jgi:hypothetical protein